MASNPKQPLVGSNLSLADIDRNHLIHPVTSFREHERIGPRILTAGDGMWLTDDAGRRVLDAFAGLWCVNVGYGQESIVEVAAEQMRRLPYATGYFHFANEPAIRLAGELSALAPAGLDHVYFTLGGSDAVDSAIRYIVHYFNAIGEPQKKQFIALEWGYHGSSANGAGLTALANFHRGFDLPRPWQHHIVSPYPYRHPQGGDDAAVIASSVAALEAKVAELGADTVAAFCCEPIQGSGGVIVPPKGWLKAMRDACTRLGILMLVDEVITAFGRTGPMFASNDEDVSPDFITVAKGLTSGYAPMGAVLMADHVYQAIADSAPEALPIGHGFTYSGLLGAIELVSDKAGKTGFASELDIAGRLSRLTWDNGVIVRCFANAVIGFAPALCCSDDEMDLIFERVRKSLDQLLEQPDIRAAIR